jgi:hypothetical protein
MEGKGKGRFQASAMETVSLRHRVLLSSVSTRSHAPLQIRYVPPPVPGDTGVVLGPIPEGKENDTLVQELRAMVGGLKPLTRDAQKA